MLRELLRRSWFPNGPRFSVRPSRMGLRFRQHEGDDDPAGGAGGGGGDGGDDDPAGGGGSGGGSGDDDGKKFSQDDVNAIMKKEREKFQAKQRETLQQLEKLREEKNLSDQQREKLDTQIADMRTNLMTEKEKVDAERQRIDNEHKRALETAEGDRDAWKGRHEASTKKTAVLAAAAKFKVYNAEQALALVMPKAVLEEVKDSKGEVTGEFAVVIKETILENDKPVEKTFTAEKYFEHLKSQKEHANLFVAERPGGTGYRPGSGSGDQGGDDLTPTQKIRAGLDKGQASASKD